MNNTSPKNKDDFFYDDYFYDDQNGYISNEYNSNILDSGVFEKRNDPKDLLYRFKLQILNAREIKEEQTDEYGVKKVIIKIKPIKNTQPLANKQGVLEIMRYIENFVNGHTVQSYISTELEHNRIMQEVSDNIVNDFWSKRLSWGMSFSDCAILTKNVIELCDKIQRRNIGDSERNHYDLSHKEEVRTNKDFTDKSPTLVQKMGEFLVGKRRR